MARKIKVVIHHERILKTRGAGVDYFTSNLGYWKNETKERRFELLKLWIDPTKYEISLLWYKNKQEHRVFKKGYAIRDQIDKAIGSIAGNGNDDVDIDYREIVDYFLNADEWTFKIPGQTEAELTRTFAHNLNSHWLKDEDTNRWSRKLTDDLDGTDETSIHYLITPSFEDNIFKDDFDPDRARQEDEHKYDR